MSPSLNLSPVSYEAWLELVFGQRVSRADSYPFRTNYRVTDDARVVAHMTRCCREFGAVSKRFTLRQLDRGIWFLMSCDFEMGAYLANPELDLQARLDCVRAMLHPYSNFVAGSRVHVMENCFEMWWDLLCGSFWSAHRHRLKGDELDAAYDAEMTMSEEEEQLFEKFLATADRSKDFTEQLIAAGFNTESRERPSSQINISYDELEPAEQTVADAMLDTLTQILYLEEQRCVQYALHGLNHLKHPRGAKVVQHFIDRHKREWTREGLAWVESCRDGDAM